MPIFGGGSYETSPTMVDLYSPGQQALMNTLMGQVQTGLTSPVPKMPQMSIPRTSEENTYFNWVNSLGSQKALQNLLSGQPGYEINPKTTEEYFEKAVRPEYLREFEEVTKPGIRGATSGPGFYGSYRMGLESNAAQDMATELARKKAELGYQDEQARRASIDTAYGRILPTTTGLSDIYGGAGQYARGIEQEKASENLQRFLAGETVDGQTNPVYNPNVALALSLLGLSPLGVGSSTTGKTSQGIGSIGSIIGGAGSLLEGLKVAGYI